MNATLAKRLLDIENHVNLPAEDIEALRKAAKLLARKRKAAP